MRIAATQAEHIKPLRHCFEVATKRLCLKMGEKFEPPLLVLSITGGAQAFQLRPHILSAITKGLHRAIAGSNAVVVTGGSATGVMEVRSCP